ncbi:MAG: histidine triad nucleotide-binding protein [Clostridia bacterium]|nr:histidine triad nucleotide-binding protein [Clostridia bacterium]
MEQCIFCKIIAGQIPSAKVYEDDFVLAFRDIDAQAPEHILVVPKQHVASILEVNSSCGELMEHIVHAIQQVAKITGIDKTGFRVAINTGKDGGQTVEHLHFHVLGGRELAWPPG